MRTRRIRRIRRLQKIRMTKIKERIKKLKSRLQTTLDAIYRKKKKTRDQGTKTNVKNNNRLFKKFPKKHKSRNMTGEDDGSMGYNHTTKIWLRLSCYIQKSPVQCSYLEMLSLYCILFFSCVLQLFSFIFASEQLFVSTAVRRCLTSKHLLRP